jgi:amino acid adenylation domain-containing protein
MHLHTIERIDDLFETDVVSRIERIAAASPSQIAVKSCERAITYRELDAEATRLAGFLANASPRAGYVALLFDHGVDMVVAALGVMKTGAGYLPLDAAYPLERLRYMWQAGGEPLVVTIRKLSGLARELVGAEKILVLDDLPVGDAATADAHAGTRRSIDSPAYLLFTSGSTGQPKGVMQTHRNLLYHTWVWVRRLGVSPQDRLSLQSAYSWDSSVQDIFSALLCGATLLPVNLKAQGFDEALEWMVREEVSVYHSTVPIFRQAQQSMADRRIVWPSLRIVAVGGDSVFGTDIEKCHRVMPDARLAYAYGSTESSTILMNVVDPSLPLAAAAVPLGEPAPGVRVFLAEAAGEREGEGEIVIATPFVCRGYLGQGMPAPKFSIDGDAPDRILFRTGDLGAYLPDGKVALVGRLDNLLKVRGMRVDAAEVEAVLNALTGVDVAVVHPATVDGDRILVAYVVRGRDAATRQNVSTLRASASERLPTHAVPSKFVFLDALPLTPNGKLDRQALPAPSDQRPELGVTFVESRSEVQRRIAAAWRAVLGVSAVGIHDNFFDLGGHSLAVARVHGILRRDFDRSIPMFQLYAHPTVAALAGYLERDEQQQASRAAGASRARMRQTRRLSSKGSNTP